MFRRLLLLACSVLLGFLIALGASTATATQPASGSNEPGAAELLKKGKKKNKKGKKNKKAKRNKGKGKKAKGPLTGRYFWRFSDFRVDRSPDPVGLYFASPKLAYYGSPEGGLPRCKKAKPKRENGELQSGCVRYKLNKKGRLKVDRLKGTFRKGSLKLDGDTYFSTTVPKPRSTYAVKLINRGYRGFCGLITGCTTWAEDLVLTKKGEFVRSRSSITTVGGHGAPFTWAGNFPPDETGKYRVLPRGRLALNYADGTRKVHTIAINHNERNRPDIVNEGIVLDDVWFYNEGD